MVNAKGKKLKGARAEYEFAKKLVDSGLDPNARRMALSGSVTGLETDILTKLPYAFEIKNQESISIWKAWEQTEKQAVEEKKGRKPVLVIKSNRRDYLVVMDVNNWIEMAIRAKL